MSGVIKNQAIVIYNDRGTPKTAQSCKTSTFVVFQNLEVHKRAITTADLVIRKSNESTIDGYVDKDRRITYEIDLINYSDKDLTNIIIKDTITAKDIYDNNILIELSEGNVKSNILDPDTIRYTNYLTGTGVIPRSEIDIELHDTLKQADLSNNSQRIVSYTITLPEEVPIGTIISNKAAVTFAENVNNTLYETEYISIQLRYAILEVAKSAQDLEGNILDTIECSQRFNYVITINNTGNAEAVLDIIDENLPPNFRTEEYELNNLKYHSGVKVYINDVLQTENTDYAISIDENTNLMLISNIDKRMKLLEGNELLIKINGFIIC